MIRRFSPALCLGLIFSTCSVAHAELPSLLRIFGKTKAAEVDASKVYELTQEDGPWLILASTLVGEGARDRANKLAVEIRSELGLPAFIYKEDFDFSGTLRYDQMNSKRVRYANEYQYEAYVVLVGEYDRVDHPSIERDLKSIKVAKPRALEDPRERAAELNGETQAGAVKVVATMLKSMSSGGKKPGPMAGAFATRNPMLPENYFESPVVDSFVSELNEDFDQHNLLQCDGKFTVVVKTFSGTNTITSNSKEEDSFVPTGKKLDKMARDANMMVRELRKKGVEAYQFHDRERSIVTVGSFESLGNELPNKGFQYNPQILQTMRTYSAVNVDPQLARQVPRNSGRASNNINMIPFDVEPTPIAIPKKTKRSLYGSLGRR
ncbi:hypothetical protein LF1_47310 [Rubripirellula obstinata]|uniref:Uncharacterized protein n=1 Tax=Rubripirellula obstinata TaxID=406547 RepID=A0A5B1CQP0_9BACT|nr:hypothetical protein [Rubripirellula obstinata]KAA1262169.1 hypothetical protein LF1_47310 [Rubripirellula obstinata]